MAKTDDTELNDDLIVIRSRYEAARDHAAAWRKEARLDYAFYAGDQWQPEDVQILTEQQRVPVTFNRIGPFVDAVVGYEMNNRYETRYIPRTAGDAKVNEMLSQVAKYFRDQSDAEFEESDAFRDDVICGMGWTEDHLSDERNPEYDLMRSRTDPFEMLWDPSAVKPNLADRRYDFRKKWMSLDEAKAMFPDWDGEYVAADWAEDDDSEADAEVHDRNPRHSYRGQDTGDDSIDRDVPVIEHQYCEFVVEHVITNPDTGEQIVIPDEQLEKIEGEAKQAIEEGRFPRQTRRRREWKRVFLIGGEIVKRDQPYPKGSTYNCITGKRDRNKRQWIGIVRALRDPQQWSNKWLSQLMHLINTSAKPGYDLEDGAVRDMAKFEANAARPGANNVFTDGALQNGRVQYRMPAGIPPDIANLMQYANQSFMDVSGINQELMGMADREQPGVLEYQRKQSAVTLLAPIFDSLRRYRKMAGRCWLYFMQHYMTDGRLVRITMDQPDMEQPPQVDEQGNPLPPKMTEKEMTVPFTEQFFDEGVAEYDVIVDQSSAAPNVKEETWAALQPMLEGPLGAMLGPEEFQLILEFSPLPDTFLEKWKEIQRAKAENPPPDPEMEKIAAMQQSEQAKLEMRKQESETEMQIEVAKTRAQLDLEREKAKANIELEAWKAQQQQQMEAARIAMERQRASEDMDFRERQTDREMKMNEDRSRRALLMKAQESRINMAASMKAGEDGADIDLEDLFGTKAVQTAISAMADSIRQLAQMQMSIGQSNAEAISKLAQAVMADNEIVRDENQRAIGTRKRMPQAMN